jgi:hypothetical protein
MTIGVTARGELTRTLPQGRVVGVGAATAVVALACGMALQAWAQGPPPRHDMFEPFLDPWVGLTWITQLVLWMAVATRRWPWLVLTAIGLCFLAIQVWMGIGSAWIGVHDGRVGSQGALVGALAGTQLCLTLVWIALIARSKRTAS